MGSIKAQGAVEEWLLQVCAAEGSVASTHFSGWGGAKQLAAAGLQVARLHAPPARHSSAVLTPPPLQVEARMFDSVHHMTAGGLGAYPTKPRHEWVLEWPGMTVLVVSSIFWTRGGAGWGCGRCLAWGWLCLGGGCVWLGGAGVGGAACAWVVPWVGGHVQSLLCISSVPRPGSCAAGCWLGQGARSKGGGGRGGTCGPPHCLVDLRRGWAARATPQPSPLQAPVAAATPALGLTTPRTPPWLPHAGVVRALQDGKVPDFEAQCTRQLDSIVDLVRGSLSSLQRITLGGYFCKEALFILAWFSDFFL